MLQQIVSDVILLYLLTDPLGAIPVLYALLDKFHAKRRNIIYVRESIIAGLILITFAFFGSNILSAMKISTSALEISGGILLFIIALRMIYPSAKVEDSELVNEPLIVPIAIPLMAGPGSLATVIISGHDPERKVSLIIAIVITTMLIIATLLLGNLIIKFLGKTGINAMERLMGLVLITIAVQMLISGARTALNLG